MSKTIVAPAEISIERETMREFANIIPIYAESSKLMVVFASWQQGNNEKSNIT